MIRDISNLRKSYTKNSLEEINLPSNPFLLFDNWFKEVKSANSESEVNAMTLSTIDSDGYPDARIVLLKYYSIEGFIFLQITIAKSLSQLKKTIKFRFLFFGRILKDKLL